MIITQNDGRKILVNLNDDVGILTTQSDRGEMVIIQNEIVFLINVKGVLAQCTRTPLTFYDAQSELKLRFLP